VCYTLRNYVPPLFRGLRSIFIHAQPAIGIYSTVVVDDCDLFFFLFIRKSRPLVHARENDRKHPERERRVLTSGAHVSHRDAIVFGLPSFHKFVLSIVRQLTPRFAQKRNENNDHECIILLYVPGLGVSRV